MGPRSLFSRIGKILPVVVLVLIALFSFHADAATKGTGNPFDLLKGYWKGSGTIDPRGGRPEKVSCEVAYTVEGANVKQRIRCAGTDYKINSTANLVYRSGKISGSWEESTYNAVGSVTGKAGGDTVHAQIDGNKFSGRMSIKVSGSTHTINIVQFDSSNGTYRPVAAVTLRR